MSGTAGLAPINPYTQPASADPKNFPRLPDYRNCDSVEDMPAMLNTFKTLLANQHEAVFCMWNTFIDRCPDSSWNEPIVNLAFCQAAFHTLFFADVYLGRKIDAVRDQSFHHDNTESFRDYEEL